MAKRVQWRRGTAAQNDAFTGAGGEVTVDITNDNLRVHDGVTAGGFATARKSALDGVVLLIDDKADLVDGVVPSSQLPSFVDDVLEFENFASLPAVGAASKIYITTDDNLTYRWGGSSYVLISSSLALGDTSSTAYRGDRGKLAYDHTLLQTNPHNVTKDQVGLGSVDNTSDVNKPVSAPTQAAIDDLSQTISNIAVSSGKGPYATVADGLADTVDGDVFTAYDGVRFAGFLNDGGVASEISSFASLEDIPQSVQDFGFMDFTTYEDFLASGLAFDDGRSISIGGVYYTYQSGSTTIAGMPDLEYANVIPVDDDFTEDEGGVFDTGFQTPYSLTMFGGDVAGYVAFLGTVPPALRAPFIGVVRVPTDAATMQDVIDALGQTVAGDDINISIEAGHSPETGISVIDGDYSGYTVTSVDPTVSVGAFTGDFIRAENAQAPVLGCKVVASGHINLVLTGAVTVVTGETLTQATSGANGVVVAGGTLSTVVLSDLDGGAFNNADELTGSTSGALGSNSIPSDLTAVSIVNGYAMYGPSTGLVLPACGVDYCYDTGLVAYEGAKVKAEEAVFNFAARASDVLFSSQKPVFKSAAHAWGAGSSIYGEKLQGNDSGFYGLQASHGGTATYRNSDSQRCWRHGIRGSDGAIIDAEAANPSNSARDGNGSCARAFESAIINAPSINCSGSGASAVRVTGGGVFNGPNGDYTGAGTQAVWAENGGRALLRGGVFDPAAIFNVGDSSDVNVFGGTGIATPVLTISSGGKFTSPSGGVFHSSTHDFEGGITFNGTGTELSRFEEGTFLPTLIATSVDFDTVVYADREGAYQRVGNRVTLSGMLRTSTLAKGAASGNIAIGNFPFSVADGALNNGSGVIGYAKNFSGQHPNSCFLNINQNYATLGRTEPTGFVNTTVADVSPTGTGRNFIMFQITYFTDEV